MNVEQLDTFLLVGAAALLLAVLAVRVTTTAGLPSLLFYLLIGVLLGDEFIGIPFEDFELAHALGFGALVLILAEGGFSTRWSEVRSSIPLGAILATVGVAVSTGLMAVAGHYVLGMEWKLAVLLGAVTAPTDAAAVFSVLRRVPLPRRLTGVLEAESGLNDAPTVLLVTAVSTGAVVEHHPVVLGLLILVELLGGVAVGLVIGFAAVWVMRRVALPAPGLYPITVLGFIVVGYAGAAAIELSGFAAVYVAALVLGNSELPHRVATKSFAEGVGWLAQIGLFVMLGLLATPDRFTVFEVLIGLAAGAILTFVARPVSVFVSAVGSGLSLRQQLFLGWAGLRGAVPIVLATIPLAEGVYHAHRLFDVVFVLVVVYTVLQGPTIPAVARWLRLAIPDQATELEVEAAPLDRVAADLLQVRIGARSRLQGVEVRELRLPRGASLSLIVRDQGSFVPTPSTVLREDDDLLVVTPRSLREETEARLQEVTRYGRLAGWLNPGRPNGDDT